MTKNNLTLENEENDYDKHVDFYYTNLINSLILFSLATVELEKLRGPAFDPLFELESEIDYAFTSVCFETIFRNKRIDYSLRDELLNFKQETNNIPSNIWDWEFIDTHPNWIAVRHRANKLLERLGVTTRRYNDDFITIHNNKGNIMQKGGTE
jgi:hypothetical protein